MNRISDCGIECKYLRFGYFNVKYIELIYILNLYKEILYKDIYDTMKHYDTSRKNGDEH